MYLCDVIICICVVVICISVQVENGGGVVVGTNGDDYSIKLILPQDISLSRKEEVTIRNNIGVLHFVFLFLLFCILSLSRKEEMTTRSKNFFCWFLLNVYSKSGGPAGVQC